MNQIRAENIAGVTSALHNARHGQRFLNITSAELDGWIGQLRYLIDAADAFTRAELSLLNDQPDWYLAIDAYVDAIIASRLDHGTLLRGAALENAALNALIAHVDSVTC